MYPSQFQSPTRERPSLGQTLNSFSLATYLLAGVSVVALCATPVLALSPPPVHLVGDDNLAQLRARSAHAKSGQVTGDQENFTETYTYTAPLPKKHVATLLWSETWLNVSTCRPPKDERLKLHKKTQYAKLSVGTSTGVLSICPDTIVTFYGPIYDLEKKTDLDTFDALLLVRHYSGYNFTMRVETILTKQ